MNRFKQTLSLLFATLVIFISCKKQDSSKTILPDNQITDAVLKIETDWDGVSQKNNYDLSSPKKESRDSDEGIAMAIRTIDQKYKEYLSNLGSNSNTALRIGNVVGVIKNDATCSGYDEIEIGMDEEDSDPHTGWDASGGNYRPNWSISGNPVLRFCIVPGNDFHAWVDGTYRYRYAVLRVTSNFYDDAFEANRGIDNEDNSNQNFANYKPASGVSYSIKGGTVGSNAMNIYRTYINSNTLLSFHVFDASRLTQTPFTQWPNFNNMSYGVFSVSVNLPYSDVSSRSILNLDDEDTKTRNYFSVDEDVSSWYSNPSSNYDNPLGSIVEGIDNNFDNTRMHLRKVR